MSNIFCWFYWYFLCLVPCTSLTCEICMVAIQPMCTVHFAWLSIIVAVSTSLLCVNYIILLCFFCRMSHLILWSSPSRINTLAEETCGDWRRVWWVVCLHACVCVVLFCFLRIVLFRLRLWNKCVFISVGQHLCICDPESWVCWNQVAYWSFH